MNNILETLRGLGPTKLSAIVAVGLGLIGFFIYLTTRSGTEPMQLLYAELQQNDAAAIAQKLDQMQVPYQVDPSGAKIMVPGEQVGRLRMAMAQAGLPNGGSVGYEIFDKGEGFGSTSFIQNINQLRALEGELARTVGTLAGIQQARVHLVLPKRELFQRQENPATASVFLRLKPGAQLTREQIASIQHLIGAAVPQLEPTQVSIVDDKGSLLARGMGSNSEELLMTTAEEKKRSYEQRLTQTIEDLLGRSLGYGKVRAQVSADLDFDRVTTNSEIFDPESQVVRSTQNVNEQTDTQDRDPLQPVTVNNNLPTGTAVEGQNAGPISSAKSSRTEETVNYEISRTTKNHVRETGQVRRLSVAVLVDGLYEKVPDSEPTYKPRPDNDLQQIRRLVESAIGYDAVRGDTVEVINMRFYNPEDDLAKEELILGLPKDEVLSIAKMAVLSIVGILVLLLVVRPLVQRALEKPEEEDVDSLLADQAAMQLAAPAGALAQDLALEAQQADDELEQLIDINRVEGRVRASSLRKVGEIVEKHPEEAVAILRNWLYQES